MDIERDRHHFDRWAPRYDRSPAQWLLFSPAHEQVLVLAEAAGAHPRDILDLGCGTGRLIERAARRWPDARLVGIDPSPAMIAEARRKTANDSRMHFEVAEAAALPLPDACIDLAVTTLSFHHWGDQPAGLREVARVLRPGGVFVLADITPPLLLRPVLRRFHAPRARRRLFAQAGLEVAAERRPLRLGGTVLLTAASRR